MFLLACSPWEGTHSSLGHASLCMTVVQKEIIWPFRKQPWSRAGAMGGCQEPLWQHQGTLTSKLMIPTSLLILEPS